MKRQVAANRIITSDNTEIKLGVVELDDTIVTRVYSLQGEQPFTEWIGGTITIKTANGVMHDTAMGKSHLLIKEDGILAGVEVAKRVFARFDPTMQVEVLINDGAHVKKGDIAMVVTGKVRSLLQTERLMLNIMQRMSGIATMTAKYVERLKGTKTHVLDTRKTTQLLCRGYKEGCRDCSRQVRDRVEWWYHFRHYPRLC